LLQIGDGFQWFDLFVVVLQIVFARLDMQPPAMVDQGESEGSIENAERSLQSLLAGGKYARGIFELVGDGGQIG